MSAVTEELERVERRAPSNRAGRSYKEGACLARPGVLRASKALHAPDECQDAPALPSRCNADGVATDVGLTARELADRLRPLRLARPAKQPFTAAMVTSWMQDFASRGIVERIGNGQRWRLTARAEKEIGLPLREMRHDPDAVEPDTRQRRRAG